MKTFLQPLLNLLTIVYSAQLVVCLFSDHADRWMRWTTTDFHAGLWCACVFLSAARWAYVRINKQ